jgi:hypothetical protein
MEGIMLVPCVERRVSGLRWLAISALVATSVACYRYVPTTVEAVQAGDHVRAVLSPEAQRDLQDRVGIDLSILEGKLLEDNGDHVVVSVPTVKLESAFGAQSLHQNVDVRRREIARVDVRQLDKFRTFGLIGIGAGAIAFATVKAFGDGGPGSPDGPSTDPPEHIHGVVFSVPVIRW